MTVGPVHVAPPSLEVTRRILSSQEPALCLMFLLNMVELS
jgi:hypothetical protein